MKIITEKQIKNLEEISTRVERAEQYGIKGKVLDDLKWLTKELRGSYLKIEDLVKDQEISSQI